MNFNTTESKRGAYAKGKRGAIVFKNDYGTLETKKVKGGSGTFVGTFVVDGAEQTRTMSGEKHDVKRRWENWQEICLTEHVSKKEVDVKDSPSVVEMQWLADAIGMLGVKLDELVKQQSRIAEALELMALRDEQPTQPKRQKPDAVPTRVKTAKEAVEVFLDAHEPYEFINTTNQQNLKTVSEWCIENGYECPSSRTLTSRMKERYGSVLDAVTTSKGTVFTYKGSKKGKEVA